MDERDEFDENGVQTRFTMWPDGSESREERLARWQSLGAYDPECRHCQATAASPRLSTGGPGHRVNPRCRSGGRPHCTCDTCF